MVIRQARVRRRCRHSIVRDVDVVVVALNCDSTLDLDGDRGLAAIVVGQAMCHEGVNDSGCKLSYLLLICARSSDGGIGCFDGLLGVSICWRSGSRRGQSDSVFIAGDADRIVDDY